MIFVATENVEENVLRVLRRAFDGGHSAPEARLREIYRRSLENLLEAIPLFDRVILYDSTPSEQRPRRVVQFSSGKLVWRSEVLPAWCTTGELAVLLRQ